VYYATFNNYATHYMPSLPHSECGEDGKGLAAAAGCAILTSYLFLFIGFYMATYRKSPSASAVKTTKKAARRASMTQVPTAKEAAIPAVEAIRSAAHSVAESTGIEHSTSSKRH
jgi:fatty acid elongase 3